MAEDNMSLKVLLRAEKFEEILEKKFGAEGDGLGQRIHSVKDRLGNELTKKLLQINRKRNEAAHKPSSFKLDDPEEFFRECDEAKAMLDTMKVSENVPSGLDSSKSSRKIPADQNHFNSISFLFYAGIIMALSVQFARANAWSLPLFKSYEDAFATSFFLTACGVAHTAYIRQNTYVSLGLVLTTIGGFAWKYKWILPIVKTYQIPLYVGILFILYGIVPQLLGAIFITAGSLLLIVELWLAFTKGLAAVHYGNLLASVIFIGLSTLMFRRQKKLARTGAFRSR